MYERMWKKEMCHCEILLDLTMFTRPAVIIAILCLLPVSLWAQEVNMAMEEFKSKYNLFYDQLSGFVSDLVTKLKPDAPSELQYVTIIPDILSMDDPDLQLANEDGVVKKAYIVVQLTELVAERAKQYVDDEDWFDEKANMVKLYLTLVTLNLATLRLSEDESPYHLEAGLGGINTGAVPTHREINVDNLKALFHVLANSAVQQSAS